MTTSTGDAEVHCGPLISITCRSGPRVVYAGNQRKTAVLHPQKVSKKGVQSQLSTGPPQTGHLTDWWPLTLTDGSRDFPTKSGPEEVRSLRSTFASAGEAETAQVLRLIRQSHEREDVQH